MTGADRQHFENLLTLRAYVLGWTGDPLFQPASVVLGAYRQMRDEKAAATDPERIQPEASSHSKLKTDEHGFLVVKATGPVITAEMVKEESEDAHVAYCTGKRLEDQRTGQEADHSRLDGVE